MWTKWPFISVCKPYFKSIRVAVWFLICLIILFAIYIFYCKHYWITVFKWQFKFEIYSTWSSSLSRFNSQLCLSQSILPFFFWLLYCLSSLRLLIIPLVSSSFYYVPFDFRRTFRRYSRHTRHASNPLNWISTFLLNLLKLEDHVLYFTKWPFISVCKPYFKSIRVAVWFLICLIILFAVYISYCKHYWITVFKWQFKFEI
jgi:hypothetical protein